MTESYDLQVLTDPVTVFACHGCGVKLDLSGRAAFSLVRCPACRLEMQVPARMGGFVLVELLGVGGMGSAYRARDEALNRDVAIKIMRKSFGDDPKFVETFRREAQIAAKLNHTNVVQIHSFGEFKGQPFIVMELVTGGSLDRLIGAGEPLDQATVMRIGMEITMALQSGYQLQLVHGDIKPENILLDEKGAAKLVDFGIAQLAGGDTNEVWGTPYYVAPEKVRRQRTDCRADIYSLGGTLYHAFAGKPPFDGPDATAVVKARFLAPAPPLRGIRPELDPEVDTIVARMLQVEPSMRYPTYESLLGDMRRFLERVGPAPMQARKQLILKKKGMSATSTIIPSTANSAAVSPATATLASTAAKPSGRLVIKKGASMGGYSSSTGGAGSTSSMPVTAAQATVAAPVNKGVPVSVVVLLVVVCLLLAGGVGLGVWFMATKRGNVTNVVPGVDPAVVAHAVAVQQISNCWQQAQSAGSNLLAWAGTAEQLCGAANKAVTDVLGQEQHDLMIPLRPPAPVKLPPPPVVATGTNAAGTNAAGTNAAGTNASSTNAVAPPAPALPAVDPVREETLKDPVLVQVRNLYRSWYAMDEIAIEAMALHDEIGTVLLAAGTMLPETLNLQALAFTERIQSLATGSKVDESRRKLANIRHDIGIVSNMVQTIRKKQEKEAAEVRRLAELEAARVAGEQKEKARRDKIATEIEGIVAKESEINDLLHKHAYVEATRKLRTVLPSLSEEESNKAYAVALQRVVRLEELRDFIASHVIGYQHPTEGWKIESADKIKVVVRTRSGTADVAWGDIGDKRMFVFLHHFLMDEEGSRSLKLREHVRMLINASMYCRRFIFESKHVQEQADKMLEKAVSMLPSAKDEIALLLPNVVLKTDSDAAGGDKPAPEPTPK
ncbi:MAG: protein kinase domain-containing protein [Kiritimatiellia bacterium]